MTIHGIKFRTPRFRRPAWEKNDCAVWTLAAAAGIPYAEAHDLFAKAGRKNGHSTPVEVTDAVLARQNFRKLDAQFIFGRALLIHVLRSLTSSPLHGRWIVGINEHIIPLRGEVVLDGGIPSLRSNVNRVYYGGRL